jgi:hypothetical protein
MSESNASAVAVLTQVLGELARVTSSYSPQQKYTLRAVGAHRQNRIIPSLIAQETL